MNRAPVIRDEPSDAGVSVTVRTGRDGVKTYRFTTNAQLRDRDWPGGRREIHERSGQPLLRTGNDLFDGLYALAIEETRQNSVESIQDGAYNEGRPMPLKAFQTGAKWPYVWTRDLAYSVHLALAQFDPARAAESLLFKTSGLKAAVKDGYAHQILQDTGTGGSYPISTDRVVWLIGAMELLDYLDGRKRREFIVRIQPIVRDTIEQDRRLVFDPEDGLYRGEQSFLDWREQTYPGWTADTVLPIGMSKAFGTNVAHYHVLARGAELARLAGAPKDAARYAAWAGKLKMAIRRRFRDPESGLHSAFLFADGTAPTRVRRHDLLGESLAILFGITPPGQARRVSEKYPTGPHGPPVVWPQESTVPIYHNCGIWPFVTAYWMLASRKVGNAPGTAAAMASLVQGAAQNLSNMENLDFVTGQAWAESHGIRGPVINSERQLWSVAGYLAMVQKVVFGMETSRSGIRFRPFVPEIIRRAYFPESGKLSLTGLRYRNKRIDLHVQLPAGAVPVNGVFQLARVELNGAPISAGYIAVRKLRPVNVWTLHLKAGAGGAAQIRKVDPTDRRAIFGPGQPQWAEPAITENRGRLTLHFQPGCRTPVTFTISRNGKVVAAGVTKRNWTDPGSRDFRNCALFYSICAVDRRSGNSSHFTPVRHFPVAEPTLVLPARELKPRGGKLLNDHHIGYWGAPGDEVHSGTFAPSRKGTFRIRVRYANGTCPINTGISCCVKRLEVLQGRGGRVVASGHLLMPGLGHGNWERFEWSSPIQAKLDPRRQYAIRIYEDEVSRNMSGLAHNQRYTAFPGGGDEVCNRADIAAIEILRLGP